jgi:hypothetical protein
MSSPASFPLHHESRALLNAPIESAFAYLDNFRKLSAHMERSSRMMLGSRMKIETDSAEGRKVGSRVRMQGSMIGMTVALEEIVVERDPPVRKAWETVDAKLIVIGQYRLGFELEPRGSASAVRVFIDYSLPTKRPARWLGVLLGGVYAKWCAERMASDAARFFANDARTSMNLRGRTGS